VFGMGAIKIWDDTEPDIQEKDTQEVLPTLGHLPMFPVWPRVYRDLPVELGISIG